MTVCWCCGCTYGMEYDDCPLCGEPAGPLGGPPRKPRKRPLRPVD